MVFNFDESEIERSSMPIVCQFNNQLDRVSGNQNQHTRDKMICFQKSKKDMSKCFCSVAAGLKISLGLLFICLL
jgi:hypothetical protein